MNYIEDEARERSVDYNSRVAGASVPYSYSFA